MNLRKNEQYDKCKALSKRRTLVKFCTPEDLKYYAEDVSLKFGTLEQYAASENKLTLGARHDGSEGMLHSVQNYSGSGKNISLGPLIFEGTEKLEVRGVTTTHFINEWVLCMAEGPYSRKLHTQILEAPGHDYPGNPKLTAYVVFDKRKLIDAIMKAVLISPENKSDLKHGVMICLGKVAYNKNMTAIDDHIVYDEYTIQKKKEKDFLETVFSKPALFAPENEVRILARFNSPKHAPPGADAIFLSSTEIKNAIVTKGAWERT